MCLTKIKQVNRVKKINKGRDSAQQLPRVSGMV